MASVQQAPAVQHPGPMPFNQAQVQEMFMVRYFTSLAPPPPFCLAHTNYRPRNFNR